MQGIIVTVLNILVLILVPLKVSLQIPALAKAGLRAQHEGKQVQCNVTYKMNVCGLVFGHPDMCAETNKRDDAESAA